MLYMWEWHVSTQPIKAKKKLIQATIAMMLNGGDVITLSFFDLLEWESEWSFDQTEQQLIQVLQLNCGEVVRCKVLREEVAIGIMSSTLLCGLYMPKLLWAYDVLWEWPRAYSLPMTYYTDLIIQPDGDCTLFASTAIYMCIQFRNVAAS